MKKNDGMAVWEQQLRGDIQRHRADAVDLRAKADRSDSIADELEKTLKRALRAMATTTGSGVPVYPAETLSSAHGNTLRSQIENVIRTLPEPFKVKEVQRALEQLGTKKDYLTIQSSLRRVAQRVSRGEYIRNTPVNSEVRAD